MVLFSQVNRSINNDDDEKRAVQETRALLTLVFQSPLF